MKTYNVILIQTMSNKITRIAFSCLLAGFVFLTVMAAPVTASEMTGPPSPFRRVTSASTPPAVKMDGLPETNHRLDKAVHSYINEMRENPKAYYHKYVENYIRQKSGRFTAKYTHSLKKAMLHAPSLPPFENNAVLVRAASLQLNYLGDNGGRLTHSQGNIGFAERMKRAGLHCLAENLYAAHDPKALEVVLDLMIDQNIPSFGHRKNLLNPMYTQIGIVSKTISGGKTIVVMDFGCKPR
jgi:uncharacterized protein YkwD